MKNYLIIGGSSGIGKELTGQLAVENKVFATYNSHPHQSAGNISYHYLNVLGEMPSFDYLPDQLNGFAYCPGAILLKPFARIKPEEFKLDFELQVIGAIKLLQIALPRLKNADASSVVLFSSVAVQTGFNFHTVVSASKGAIEGLTRSLAAEFAPKIRVNCIAPSVTHTGLSENFLNTDIKRESNAQRHPLKRIGTAEDIAEMAAFLISGRSSFITGQIFPVDGGMQAIR